jgi:hypothetical protein
MSSDAGGEKNVLATQWSRDGRRILILLPGGDDLTIVSLPQNSRGAIQSFLVAHIDNSEQFGFLPFPEVNNQLFVTGDKVRAGVDLDTGKTSSHGEQEKTEIFLYEAGEKIVYLKPVGSEKKDEPKDGVTNQDSEEKKNEGKSVSAYELGELDQKDLSLHPTLTVKIDELNSKGIGDLNGFLDVFPGNLKIAATEDPLKGQPARVLVIGPNGVERAIETGIKEESFKLGNSQWSRDAKTIYVAALIANDTAKTYEFAVVELSADGNSRRIDQIYVGPQDEMGSDYLSTTQIALSPDGKFIAASNGYTDTTKPGKAGLFLLDLSKPNRPVNFYPAPVLPKLPDTE